MKRMTNKERVLEYMREEGSITSLDAFRELGNTRLSASIWDLIHRDGYDIRSITEKRKNRWGEDTYFSRYYLGGSDFEKYINEEVLEDDDRDR
jgi:hypothetical protein